jgi:hypothetical protein
MPGLEPSRCVLSQGLPPGVGVPVGAGRSCVRGTGKIALPPRCIGRTVVDMERRFSAKRNQDWHIASLSPAMRGIGEEASG